MQELAPAFIEPRNATHRQYEALRAFFVDERPQTEVAKAFGYSVGAFRVMCCVFRKSPQREFFIQPRRGPKKVADKQDNMRERIVALRKKNLSIYDICLPVLGDTHP